ncbi:MAG: ATP-binding protein [Sporichthyaceae bacterium]
MVEVSYERAVVATVVARLREPRTRMQVLAGPRQSGKTTAARQAVARLGIDSHYTSADQPTLQNQVWLAEQWEVGRSKARGSGRAVLVLDEVQKVPDWSEVVKRLWDEDTISGIDMPVVLLGSAPLLVQRGLSESLAGRFEVIRVPHWSYTEMHDAFGFDLDSYIYFGGYPGGAALIADRRRWASFLLEALIETTVSRDVLLLTRVDKPALLRQLFALGCGYSGQIVSYQKLVGQLQDAGNTTTLAHYLDLLSSSGLLMGIQKYSGAKLRQRASSPKLLALNTGLVSVLSPLDLAATRARPDLWGRLVESAVGAHLVASAADPWTDVTYWRESSREVDFVLSNGQSTVAIEVKSGRQRGSLSGLDAFLRANPGARPLIVGAGGLGLAEFLSRPADDWLLR